MRRVVLDTVGLLAIWDEADQWHRDAERSMADLATYPCEFYTSDCVLLECGNASARKAYRSDVVELRKSLGSANRILVPTDDEIEMAWRSYENRLHANSGIVDQLSFVLMKRLGIYEVFTNDEHFRSAGLTVLF